MFKPAICKPAKNIECCKAIIFILFNGGLLFHNNTYTPHGPLTEDRHTPCTTS